MKETGYKNGAYRKPLDRPAAALGATTTCAGSVPGYLHNIHCSWPVMKYFHGLKISLVAKLVLAFVLVAVIPMLVASKITTALIAEVVNRNIERWLGKPRPCATASRKPTRASRP